LFASDIHEEKAQNREICYIVSVSSLAMPLSKHSHRQVIYLFCALLVTLSLFTLFGERGVLHLWRLRGEKKKLEERNFLLVKENEALRERIHRLRHDDLYLEKIAREDLGLVRQGEIIYRFASPDARRNRTKAVSEHLSEPLRSSGQK
jgi:cell division protein FtsB